VFYVDPTSKKSYAKYKCKSQLFLPIILGCTLIASKKPIWLFTLHTLNLPYYFYLPYLNAISDERTKDNPHHATFTHTLTEIAQAVQNKRTPGNDAIA